jgi:phage repressor protein C with HTH and peptisase S24 domain
MELGDRLRSARGKRSRAEVARHLGVHENTVAKMERGESAADLWQLQQVADLTGCGFGWLVGVELQRSSVSNTAQAVETDDHIYVPLFDLRAAAGHGAFNEAEDVLNMRPFASDYIRRELGISHLSLAMITVVGGSMEPMIHDGDVVLVDLLDTSVAAEGPHLIRMDGALLVKLLERRPGGRLRVRSKNAEFEPFDVDQASPGGDFQILGRVRWGGVTFR